MRAVRRVAGVDLGVIVDAGTVAAGIAFTAFAAWAPRSVIGVDLTGPAWLRVLLPLLFGVPLALRRRAPLLMWIAIWAVIALQLGVTGHLPQGLEWFVPFVGAYSLGARASPRRSAVSVGLGVAVILASRQGFSVIPLVVVWLVGVFVQTRRRSALLARRNAALQRQAKQAAAAERTRIARELHDIVAHHLSVIVLQAAGARASGKADEATLEKIENSGRQALADTRRLLDVVRDPSEAAGLAPQPGIGDLDNLIFNVTAAGLPVNLIIHGDHAAVPAAVDVSVYRIVQEALTNVLKHAGHARADVMIGCAEEAVTIEVTDDGTREPVNQLPPGGRGLAGMRERVAIFGGELRTGPRPGGGFAVQARLPLGDGLPPAGGPS